MTTDTDALPDMLHWYEGMLLLPEHFQAAGRRQEMLSGHLTQFASPHGWGVGAVAIDIGDDRLRVTAVEGVLPDGSMVRHAASSGDDALEIDLGSQRQRFDTQRKATLFLTIVKWSDRDLAQIGPDAGALARFRSVRGQPLERDDPDPAVGDPASEAMRERPWLRPILGLHLGDTIDDVPARYTALPLARIMRMPDGKLARDPRYEPPRVAIGDAPAIVESAAGIAKQLRDKAQFLDERLRHKPVVDHAGARGAADAISEQLGLLNRRFQMLQRNVENLQALARTVPRLEGLIGDGRAHPFTLYLTLCDIVGDLALLGGELNLPKVPAYRHPDPLDSLEQLESLISRMLASISQRFRVLEFDRTGDGRFEFLFQKNEMDANFVIGAVRGKGESTDGVNAWIENAKISTDGKLADLKVRRIGGAERKKIDQDEGLDLGAQSMTSLFRVRTSSADADPNDRLLVIENTDPNGPVAILLYLPRDGYRGEPASADEPLVAPAPALP